MTIKELRANNCTQVTTKNGVYIVRVPDNFDVHFTSNTTAMRTFKTENDMLYDPCLLEEKYILSNTRVVYIGKAERKGGIRARVRELVRYGNNECKNHRGGRAIWQIIDNESLILEEMPIDYTRYASARDMEKAMLLKYENLPVGNQEY